MLSTPYDQTRKCYMILCDWVPPVQQAYADYDDLMTLTEDLVSSLVKEVTGSYVVSYHADGPDAEPTSIDFSPGWVCAIACSPTSSTCLVCFLPIF